MSIRNLLLCLAFLVCGASLGAAAWTAIRLGWADSACPVAARPEGDVAPENEARGDLVFDKSEIDLGAIREPAECSFNFTNNSTVPLTIHSVEASCSCTVAKLAQATYPQGGRGAITVRIQPRSGTIGPQASRIVVDYTTSERRTARLLIRLKFQPDVIVPAEVAMRCVQGLTSTASFTLVDFRDEPLKILRIGTSSAGIAAIVRQTPVAYLPGWQYEIEVTLRDGVAVSTDRRESVILYTSDTERPEIVVGVLLKHVDRVRVSPGILVLAEEEKESKPAANWLYVDDTEGGAVSVGAVTPSHPCLRCELEQNGTQRPRLRVRYADDLYKQGDGPLSVSVKILSPVREVVCVKVFARRR
jgi:hypothetical protein